MAYTNQAEHQLSQSISRKMGEAIQQTMDMLADARRVVVICHINPDADAIGSASAMVMALAQRGIHAMATYGSHQLPSKSLLTLPGWETFIAWDDVPEDIDTIVCVDTASRARLGKLADRVAASDRVINIDHHDTNEMYGDVNLVDMDAESTTMVLLDLFEVWGIKLSRDMGHAMYGGLLTDTASFHFGRARMHTAAARMLGTGLDPAVIAADLIDNHPYEYLPFLGRVLATAGREPEWGGGQGLFHVTVDNEAMGEGIGHDEVEGVVGVIRSTIGGGVAAILKEYTPGIWTLSLRSLGRIDVSEVAKALGGGGHMHRAGLTIHGTRDDVLEALKGVSDVAAATLGE